MPPGRPKALTHPRDTKWTVPIHGAANEVSWALFHETSRTDNRRSVTPTSPVS
jgi:hypothetical protein